MHKRSHNQYEVDVWFNAHGQIEMKVTDTHRVTNHTIAHLVQKDEVDEISEDGLYSVAWVENQNRIEEGYNEGMELMSFEDIDREAAEHVENTLYWKLGTDGHWWSRMPLSSWQSMAACGEFIEWEVLWGEERLERAFSDLRDDYMEECQDEVSKLMP